MAHIHIVRSHHLGLEAARAAADRVADDLRVEHGVKAHWQGDTLLVRGTGVTGTLEVNTDLVDVRVKLRLAMRPFRRTLEKEINAHLDEHLGGGI